MTVVAADRIRRLARQVQSGRQFARAEHVSNGVRVDYSFRVLTTTGFGD
jgi:hypothetical protein